MTKKDLTDLVFKYYPKGVEDPLASFIVSKIDETFQPEKDSRSQVTEIMHVLGLACDNLDDIISAMRKIKV